MVTLDFLLFKIPHHIDNCKDTPSNTSEMPNLTSLYHNQGIFIEVFTY